MAKKYQCPLFVWKSGKLLAKIHGALTEKWKVHMHPIGEMVEMRISSEQDIEPLMLNLYVSSGKALWAYIDLPVISTQLDLLKEVTDHLKTKTEAQIGPSKRRIKFKYKGEPIETETTTAEVYSWPLNYGLRYSLASITRFLTALDAALREHGGRGLEGNEFFVTYHKGKLHLQEPSLSFVLVTAWGYYSAFLYLGEERLEIQVCDEEKKSFPSEKFDKVVKTMMELFESEKEITLKDT